MNWDVTCDNCHIHTDEKGIQIIYKDREEEIEYSNLKDVEFNQSPLWKETFWKVYIWVVSLIIEFVTGILFLNLFGFPTLPTFLFFAITIALTGLVSKYSFETVKAYTNDDNASVLLIRTYHNDIKIVRDKPWPSGFEQFLFSKRNLNDQ